MLTLMGLALGVGMLVDNSVVVLDSIESTISKRGKSKEAIVEAVSKVVAPITAATLTSVVVFIPVLLLGGMATELFKDMSAAIIISILSSLIVSVTFIPIVSDYFLKIGTPDPIGFLRGSKQIMSSHWLKPWKKRLLYFLPPLLCLQGA